MIRYKFGTRDHRGGLKESIATSKYISKEEFNKLLKLYEFYAYDERVNQFIFILRNMQKDWKSYKVWLFIEISIK